MYLQPHLKSPQIFSLQNQKHTTNEIELTVLEKFVDTCKIKFLNLINFQNKGKKEQKICYFKTLVFDYL